MNNYQNIYKSLIEISRKLNKIYDLELLDDIEIILKDLQNQIEDQRFLSKD